MIGVDGMFFCRYMVLDDMILDDRGIGRSVLKLPVQNRRTSYPSLDLLNSNRSTQSSLYWSLINRVQSLVKHILSSSSENQRLQGSTKIHMVWPHWIMIVEALEMEPVKIYGQVTLHLLMENLSQKALRTNDEKYMVRINSVDGIKKLSRVFGISSVIHPRKKYPKVARQVSNGTSTLVTSDWVNAVIDNKWNKPGYNPSADRK